MSKPNEQHEHLETLIQAKKEIDNLQTALHQAETLNTKQEKVLDDLRLEYRSFVDLTASVRVLQKRHPNTMANVKKVNEAKLDDAISAYRTREATNDLPFG